MLKEALEEETEEENMNRHNEEDIEKKRIGEEESKFYQIKQYLDKEEPRNAQDMVVEEIEVVIKEEVH